MCDGCKPARERGPKAYLEYVRGAIQDNDGNDKIARAFELAQHVIEDGYCDADVQRFYDIFKSYALPWQPPKHWEMLDQRMRKLLELDDDDENWAEERQHFLAEISTLKHRLTQTENGRSNAEGRWRQTAADLAEVEDHLADVEDKLGEYIEAERRHIQHEEDEHSRLTPARTRTWVGGQFIRETTDEEYEEQKFRYNMRYYPDSAMQQFAQLRAWGEQWRDSSNTLKAERDQWQKHAGEWKTYAEGLKAQLQSSNAALAAESSRRNLTISAGKEIVAERDSRITQLETQLAGARKEVAEWVRQHSDAQDTLNTVCPTFEEVEKELAQANEEIKNLTQLNAELEGRIDFHARPNAELKAITAERDALQIKLEAIKEFTAPLMLGQTTVAKELEAMKAERDAAIAEAKMLRQLMAAGIGHAKDTDLVAGD